MVRKHSPQTSR